MNLKVAVIVVSGLMFVSASAIAESCRQRGNTVYCDDGTSYRQSGNTVVRLGRFYISSKWQHYLQV